MFQTLIFAFSVSGIAHVLIHTLGIPWVKFITDPKIWKAKRDLESGCAGFYISFISSCLYNALGES